MQVKLQRSVVETALVFGITRSLILRKSLERRSGWWPAPLFGRNPSRRFSAASAYVKCAFISALRALVIAGVYPCTGRRSSGGGWVVVGGGGDRQKCVITRIMWKRVAV